MRRAGLVLGFDGGNIAFEQGGACEIIPEFCLRNALRNGYEMDAP